MANIFTVFAVLPLSSGYVSKELTLQSTAALPQALFAYVKRNPELHGCYFIDGDTFAPITFDVTHTLRGNISSYRSDQFATTFDSFSEQLNKYQNDERYISSDKGFCRVIKSKSGKAGDFFNKHDPRFGGHRRNPGAPFETGIFNSPDHYFHC